MAPILVKERVNKRSQESNLVFGQIPAFLLLPVCFETPVEKGYIDIYGCDTAKSS